MKETLIASQIEAADLTVRLTTSRTRFGERRWFECPACKRRAGVLYQHPLSQVVACRTCLNLKYRKSRYKGMAEEKITG